MSNTVLAEKTMTMLPSEALNREFDLAHASLAELDAPIEQSKSITTHAVMVGNIGLLLPENEVSELIDRMTVCRLPNTETWFNGVTTVRGNMIPVFDLHELFAIDHENLRRRLIVVGEAETAVAFWVDDYPRLIALAGEDSMTSAPPIPLLIKDHSREFYLRDGQVWVDWNVESFFTMLGEML
ncbi:MAG: chemotaxis protein CheW [Gammaproteobacteria bacterium]|nr:chemotaxis protein CheW [Gammaproteobacteria bacterium]